ncbi:MAG: hypothetical protein IT565_05430 [Rhodospirillales bacterium]|nr:hypothetical protein [Rhodospirillales bacterium]
MSRRLVLAFLLAGCAPTKPDYALEPPGGPHLFDRLVRENRHQDLKAAAERELAAELVGRPLDQAADSLATKGASCPPPIRLCTYENRYGFVAFKGGKLVEERNTYYDWTIALEGPNGTVTKVTVEVDSSKAPVGR